MHKEKRGLPVHKWMYSKYKNGGSIIAKKIDECSEFEWEDKEKYWISYYKNLGYNLLNLDEGGKGVITKEKRSKSSIQRSIDGHKVPIIALNKDGSFYKEYDSILTATKEHNLKSMSSINNNLRGRSKSAGGYIWIYKKDYNPDVEYLYKTKKLGEYLYEFDLNGNLLKVWDTSYDYYKKEGGSSHSITNAIENKTIYRDHYWSKTEKIDISKYENPFNYQVLDTSTKEITKFRTQSEICKFTGAHPSTVSMYIKENKLIYNKYLITKI